MNIYVIPDTQQKEGVFNPLIPVAYHIAHIRPDIVIHMGDHWDFPSLSYYDKGKKSMEAKTYLKDVEAGNKSMREFWAVFKAEWPRYRSSCKFKFLIGNHEMRRHRAMEYGSNDLRDLMELKQPDYTGWEVMPFLKVLKINGVNFSHYFPNLNSDKPITSARMLLMKKHSSSVAAHQQGFDYAEQLTDKKRIQAVIAGSCYFHDEEYKPQSNHHWRGTFLLRDVKNGMFEFNRYDLYALAEEYGL